MAGRAGRLVRPSNYSLRIAWVSAAWSALATAMLCAQVVQNVGYTASTPVKVRLSVEGRAQDGQLVGYTDAGVVLRSGSGGRQTTIPVARIDRAFFDVTTPRAELNDALVAGDFGKAGVLMLPAVRPLLPFLHLPQNNGVGLVDDTAHYLLKSTGFRLGGETSVLLSKAGVARAKSASALFHGLGKASWSELVLVGQARTAEALLALGKREMADEVIAEMAEPFPGDRAMGSYCYVECRIMLSSPRPSA